MFIISFFRYLLYLLQTILMPWRVVQRAIKNIRIPPMARFALELLVVAAVIIILFVANRIFHVDRYLRIPRGLESLGPVWLPLIGALVYIAGRLILFIIDQLPSAEVEFPDIDAAFQAGLEALDLARIPISDTPIYLVIGMPPEMEESFCRSPLVGADVHVTDRALPIHWFGNPKGIWLNLHGVSAVVKQSQLVRSVHVSAPIEEENEDNQQTLGVPITAKGGEGTNLFTPSTPTAPRARPASNYATIATNDRSAAPVSEEPEEGYRSPSRRLTAEEMDRASRRIAYVAKLLREIRSPILPVNAALLVLPYEWTTSPGLSRSADTVQCDMQALQNELGARLLCLTVLTGIEKSNEFAEYLRRLGPSELEGVRCGCRFPDLTVLKSVDIERVHQWLIGYFERQVFNLYLKRMGDPGNGKLFRLLHQLRQSKASMARLLAFAFPEKGVSEPFYFGGLYFTASSKVSGVELPFFNGVLDRLVKQHEECIGWTQRSLADDRRRQRWSTWAIVAIVLLTLLDAFLILWKFFYR